MKLAVIESAFPNGCQLCGSESANNDPSNYRGRVSRSAGVGVVQRPTQGYQLGDPLSGYDVVFPLTITQCDPVLIYYNISNSNVFLSLITTVRHFTLQLHFPAGVGYLNWNCNIPTGYTVIAEVTVARHYTVQPGLSDTCLDSVTTTYPYADYWARSFPPYSQRPPFGNPSQWTSPPFQPPTGAFPTSPFSTSTANPDGTPPTTATSTVSITLSSPPITSSALSSLPTPVPSATRHKSIQFIMTGGIVGGVTLVLLTAAIIFACLRKRRYQHTDAALDPFAAETEPKASSGFTKSQPGPPHFSTRLPPGSRNVTSTPPAPPKPKQPPEQSTSESSGTSGNSLASALENFTQLTASQQRTLIASLSATNPDAPEAPSPPPALADTQIPAALSQPLTSYGTHEGSPDIATRAQLSPGERHELVVSLDNLLVSDQAIPADLTRVSLPLPYAG